MCCRNESHQCGGHRESHHSSSCACGEHTNFGSCFLTKKEKIAKLDEYLEELKVEEKAIEERIIALKAEE
jgi:hypothetical protein